MSLVKIGVILANPFAVNLHLKPPEWRVSLWGNQARELVKEKKSTMGIRCPS
jgi:hypothetical protein